MPFPADSEALGWLGPGSLDKFIYTTELQTHEWKDQIWGRKNGSRTECVCRQFFSCFFSSIKAARSLSFWVSLPSRQLLRILENFTLINWFWRGEKREKRSTHLRQSCFSAMHLHLRTKSVRRTNVVVCLYSSWRSSIDTANKYCAKLSQDLLDSGEPVVRLRPGNARVVEWTENGLAGRKVGR